MNTSVFVQVKTAFKENKQTAREYGELCFSLLPLSQDESEASCVDGKTGFQTWLSYG